MVFVNAGGENGQAESEECKCTTHHGGVLGPSVHRLIDAQQHEFRAVSSMLCSWTRTPPRSPKRWTPERAMRCTTKVTMWPSSRKARVRSLLHSKTRCVIDDSVICLVARHGSVHLSVRPNHIDKKPCVLLPDCTGFSRCASFRQEVRLVDAELVCPVDSSLTLIRLNFACSPAPLGMTVHCRIERRSTRSGSYRLYVENPALNSRRFLLASQVGSYK